MHGEMNVLDNTDITFEELKEMTAPKKDFANKYRRLLRAFYAMTPKERKVAIELLPDELEKPVEDSKED